jgi:hypothetical protein
VAVGGCRVIEPRHKLWGGETIELAEAPDERAESSTPEDIPLQVVHEDDSLMVIDKPAGLVVHPGSGNWSGTLLNALLHHAAARQGAAGRHRASAGQGYQRPDGRRQDARGADRSGAAVAGAHRQAFYQALVRGIVERRAPSMRRSAGIRPCARRMAVVKHRQAGAHALSGARALRRLHADRMRAGNRAHAPDPRAHDVDRAIRWSATRPTEAVPAACRRAPGFPARRCMPVVWR